MATWTGVTTNAGVTLLNSWINGSTFTIDRAAGGSGSVPTASLVSQISLVNQLQTGDLVTIEQSDNYRNVKIQFTSPTTGYKLRQIGLWAHVNSGSRKLLAIFQHDEGIDIPSHSSDPLFVYTFYAKLMITNNGDITLTVNPDALVSQSTFVNALAEKQDIIDINGLLKGEGGGTVVRAVPNVDYGLPMLSGDNPPGTSTVGVLGQHYFSGGVEYVLKSITNNQYNWGVVSGAKHVTVTLPASGWSAAAPYSQSVSVNGIKTSGSDYIVTGSAAYLAAGVYMAVPTAANRLTFYADISKPTAALTVDVLIIETDEASSVYNVGSGQPRINVTGMLKGGGNGVVRKATGGTDYQPATQTLPAMTSIQLSDLVPFYNGDETQNQKITMAQLKRALGVASPTIAVTTCAGASVTCVNGSTTLTDTGSANFELPNIGTWTVSASLSGITVSATVNVTGVMLYEVDLMIPVSLAITHAPTKTVYGVGEAFDPAGLEATITYADNTTADVTDDCTWSPSQMAANTTQVTISCTKSGRTVTANQAVTIKQLSSIAVTTAPTKTSYYIGETVDVTGMAVTATYSNGSTEVVSGWTYSPTTALTANSNAITVSYTERGVTKTATQAITIKQLSSISITHAPTKTAYKYGETFAAAGMVVTATYAGGSTRTVTGYTCSPSTALTLSDTAITVSYTEGSITKTATQAITVANTLRSIAVTTPPTKRRYFTGQTFATAGMVVTATYADGTTAVVNGWTYSPSTALTAGTNAVTVSYTYNGDTRTASTAITVIAVSNILNENSWEVIQMVALESLGSTYWNVGDVKAVEIHGTVGAYTFNGTYYCHIIGFNHNSSVEGIGIHFEFGKSALVSGKDVAYVDQRYNENGSNDGFRMNLSAVNAGGWKDSYMRNTICPQFLAALPSDLRSVIASCTKYTDNVGENTTAASNVTPTSDKIWLLAVTEAHGTSSSGATINSAEKNYQAQYAYYSNGNSSTKYKHNSTNNSCDWWYRSVGTNYTGAGAFCYESSTGPTTAAYHAFVSHGFSPCFKVG